jgi:hypothetical protein
MDCLKRRDLYCPGPNWAQFFFWARKKDLAWFGEEKAETICHKIIL